MGRAPQTSLREEDRALLDASRVAHLATASRDGRPHVVPLCYAVLDENTLVFALDDKPKAAGRTLRRMRNLAENERFALVVDRWDESWNRLAYVLVEGTGALLEDDARGAGAIEALRARYPQYVEMGLRAGAHPVVELRIESVHRWAADGPAGG